MAGNERYPVPSGFVRTEDVILRSRFIASLDRADTPDDAQAFLERIRNEFPDATHNCWAYLIGSPGTTGQVGMSDDGEPHGTAGRPMLNKLVHSGAGDLAVVVTRYYGGTKLGKGGLVRAYSGAVQSVLDAAEMTDRITWHHVSFELEYSEIEVFKRLYPEYEVELLGEEFAVKVAHEVRLPVEQVERFSAVINEKTNGRICL